LTRGKVGVFVLALLASLVVGAALWRGLNPPGIPVKTVKAEEKLFEDKILATGKVEVAKEVTVASVKGAKVEKILVREGEEVEEGQVLALLDLREEINTWQDKVRAAEAALGVAEAELASLKQVRPEELEQVEAELKAAREQLQEIQAGLENARRKLERYRFLRDQGALSPAELEGAEAEVARYEAQKRAAEARMEGATARLKAMENPDPRKIEVQERRVEQARLSLAEAQRQLAEMRAKREIKAPGSGKVLQVNIKEGDFASPGPPFSAWPPGK